MGAPRGFTDQQRLFCKIYLANGYKRSAAAIAAGYSKKAAREVAYDLLNQKKVKKYLEKRMKEVEKKFDVAFEDKMQLLWNAAKKAYGTPDDVVEKIMSREDLTKEEALKLITQFHPSGLVASVAELNKMQGHYAAEKKEITHDVGDKTTALVNKYQRDY